MSNTASGILNRTSATIITITLNIDGVKHVLTATFTRDVPPFVVGGVTVAWEALPPEGTYPFTGVIGPNSFKLDIGEDPSDAVLVLTGTLVSPVDPPVDVTGSATWK